MWSNIIFKRYNQLKMEAILKQAKLIHFTLIGGCLLYAALVVFLKIDFFELQFQDSIYLYAYVFLSFIVFPLERYLFGKAKHTITENMQEEEKQQKYLSAKITSWALLEALALFAIAMLYNEANLYFVVFGLIALLTLIIRFPNELEMKRDFKLKND